MELSALVGHVLSVYQRHYAGEAFISTAKAPSSLVRHAHRLAYDPDPGVAASGYVVLFAKELVGGSVAARLPLASVPLGEIKAQDYETREDVVVDAVLNELVPLGAQKPVQIAPDADEVRLEGVGHGLETGDTVALLGPRWRRLRREERRPRISARTSRPSASPATSAAPRSRSRTSSHRPMLLAHPARTLRPFGVNADPARLPARQAQGRNRVEAGGVPEVLVRRPARRRDRLRRRRRLPLRADRPDARRRVRPALDRLRLHGAEGDGRGRRRRDDQPRGGGAVHDPEREARPAEAAAASRARSTSAVGKQTIAGHVSGTVTAIQVSDQDGRRPAERAPAPGRLADGLGGRGAARHHRAQPGAAGRVAGSARACCRRSRPGGRSSSATAPSTVAQVVTIRRAELVAASDLTRIWWEPVTPTPAAGWRLDDLKVFGNVARVSHGRTVEETVGGSDGVSAFQRFALGEAPLTVLPGRGRRRARARGARRRRPVDARPGLRRQRSRRPPLSQRHRRGARDVARLRRRAQRRRPAVGQEEHHGRLPRRPRPRRRRRAAAPQPPQARPPAARPRRQRDGDLRRRGAGRRRGDPLAVHSLDPHVRPRRLGLRPRRPRADDAGNRPHRLALGPGAGRRARRRDGGGRGPAREGCGTRVPGRAA